MPRTILSRQADAERDLALFIKKEVKFSRAYRVCEKTGLSPTTLRKRLKNPDEFTLGNLRDIRRETGASKDRLMALIGGVL